MKERDKKVIEKKRIEGRENRIEAQEVFWAQQKPRHTYRCIHKPCGLANSTCFMYNLYIIYTHNVCAGNSVLKLRRLFQFHLVSLSEFHILERLLGIFRAMFSESRTTFRFIALITSRKNSERQTLITRYIIDKLYFLGVHFAPQTRCFLDRHSGFVLNFFQDFNLQHYP